MTSFLYLKVSLIFNYFPLSKLIFIPLPKCKEAENLLMYEIISFKTPEEKLIYTTDRVGALQGFFQTSHTSCHKQCIPFLSPSCYIQRSLAHGFIHGYAFIQTGNNKKKKS